MFFTREKGEQNQLQGYLRRILDLTSPNLPRQVEFRGHDRHNRSIPVVLTPWENGMPIVSETVTALSKDISDQGLSVIISQPFRCDEAVVGFWLPHVQDYDPWFFRGLVRPNVPIGGGFWALGLEATELLTVSYGSEVARLVPLVTKLLPPTALEKSPPSAMVGK